MQNRFDDELIDEYYQRFNRCLSKLPTEERTQTQLELRQHLNDLIEAHREAGVPDHEVIPASLQRLGDPRELGKSLIREWRKRQRSPQIAAMAFSFACISGVTVSCLVVLLVTMTICAILGNWELMFAFKTPTLVLIACAIPLVAGPLAGRKLGREAARGMARACLLSFAILAMLSCIGPAGPHSVAGILPFAFSFVDGSRNEFELSAILCSLGAAILVAHEFGKAHSRVKAAE